MVAGSPGRKGRCALAGDCRGLGLQSRRAPDMPEEAGFPPAKRFRPGCGPPGGRVVMLLTAGGGGGGGGGRRQQQPVLAQPAASPYPEAVERQRRSLPIFQARGQLLAQLRNLDSAVLIGEWPRLVLRRPEVPWRVSPSQPRSGPGWGGEAPLWRRPQPGGQRPRCPAESRSGDFGACKSVGPSSCGRRPRGRAFGAQRWGGACCLGAACRGDSGGTERMSFRGRKEISGS